MPHNHSVLFFHVQRLAKTMARVLGAVSLLGHLAIAAKLDTPPIANVIMGGAELRCSSYTGSGHTRNCLANWDTILAQDPAFEGLTADDISFDADYPVPTFTYSLTQGHLDALRQVPEHLFDRVHKMVLLAHLQQLLQDDGLQEHLPWDLLLAQIKPLTPGATTDPVTGPPSGPSLRLAASEMAMLRSALVDRVPNVQRKIEARSTLFTANAATQASTAAFVAAARAVNGGQKPLIGVITASAGPHPFVDRDINVFALRSAGANAVYVPLEGGFPQALDADDCGNLRYYYDSYNNPAPDRMVFHADLQFPDLAQQQMQLCENHGHALNALLNRLNAVYFSGGNQARHLDSLVRTDAAGDYTLPSAQLQILQRRFAQGQLVVGGTSAGDQFQGGGVWNGKPVPMIGGGDSYAALRRGFEVAKGPTKASSASGPADQKPNFDPVLYPLGGLGAFRFGVLDSHFSRRVREGRLLRATMDSGLDYGFGVDENTALLVSRADAAGTTHFSVLGAGGVFIADVRQAKASSDTRHAISLDGVRAHYLLPGDTATIDTQGQLRVTLNTEVPVLPATPRASLATQDRVLDYGSANFLNLATAMGRRGAWLGFGSTQNSTNPRARQSEPYYSVTLSRDEQTVFRGGGVELQADAKPTGGAVSYTGLRVQFAPCIEVCKVPDPLRVASP